MANAQKKLPQFTLGVEEEYMIIDPVTRDLRSHMSKIVEGGKITLKEQVKAEMHQSVVEVGTNICQNVAEARREVSLLRNKIFELASAQGLVVGASSTHPFAKWQDQEITDDPRYHMIVNELKDIARSNLIFGLHVHVGIENRETALQLMNQACYFLPHIYALTTNSPFWEGRNTGFKAFRAKVFAKFPRTGLPEYFDSVQSYDNFLETLVKTNCIDNPKKIWWDLRMHPFFSTIEFRICDMCLTVDETICIVALIQAVVAKLYKLLMSNTSFNIYRIALIRENKFRAARNGVEGLLIDFGRKIEVPTKELIMELLDFVEDVVDELGSREEINYVHKILERGTGADQQLAVFEKTGSLEAVVDFITGKFTEGI
ncbi:MAG: carboxylate-amine ligase [Algoriphagus sp.]|jgi:carboxylate-amine ligase|uniref:carboxylate-amine ligase n=1 Tax=Algoriphagus sp. TaxID=1872435 RepID=UPI0027270131|nr:carboxylate-amine ligase [Algoriphagus sp.]MDO8967442.1 carboxylate-amine ligase [Algoriphagus sp.]MDP2042023.1 carboxylate-amine ligase [Algoriphagus sp.]MDP3201752.1 carboxylate-amine ligase [Algoriphagus sp.]MDP3470258.1 carboxylate-amine ligase [Algoriphagus sp.]